MRLHLRGALLSVGLSDRIEKLHDIVVAGDERARHLDPQDQQVGDEPGLETLAIDPMIGGERRDRAQDRGPLEIVKRAADCLSLPAAANGI